MNNKLKIYARETRNGKEIDLTQLVSVSSPIHKTVPPIKKNLLRSINQNKFNTEKGSQSLSIKQRTSNYSFAKHRLIPKNNDKRNKSVNKQITVVTKRICSADKYKSRTPIISRRPISKEKIEESINIIIKLKERITQFNNQIDLYEEEHNTIFSLGQEGVSELKSANDQLIIEFNKTKKNASPDYSQQCNQLKDKKRTNDMLKKQIEEHEHSIQCLMEKHMRLKSNLEEHYFKSLNSLKEIYQQKIMTLDKQIESIALNNNNSPNTSHKHEAPFNK